MADFRQSTRVSGLKAQPFTNMRPVGRVARGYGAPGFRSGVYDRMAAQYTAPLQAQMRILRSQRGMSDAFKAFGREEQGRALKRKQLQMMAELVGGGLGDLAEWGAAREGERQADLRRILPHGPLTEAQVRAIALYYAKQGLEEGPPGSSIPFARHVSGAQRYPAGPGGITLRDWDRRLR